MSSPDPIPPSGRRVPRWMWVALIASLAVNLFVVGVVARSVWPFRYAEAGRGGGLAGNLMAYAATLPEARRAAVRQPTAQERPQLALRPLRIELRAARREAALAFKAEPFNREAFLAAEARVQAAEAKLRQTVVRFSADIAGRMTAEERSGFLKWRELRRPGGPTGQADRDLDKDAPPKKPAE